MTKNLPPLAPLRTFEAAARLGGFTQAAQSLNITQGAASYQIKMLEERIGATLFLRERTSSSDAERLALPRKERNERRRSAVKHPVEDFLFTEAELLAPEDRPPVT